MLLLCQYNIDVLTLDCCPANKLHAIILMLVVLDVERSFSTTKRLSLTESAILPDMSYLLSGNDQPIERHAVFHEPYTHICIYMYIYI